MLEAGALRSAPVFAGVLDVTSEPGRDGRCVLVVEDDYFLATDVTRALQSVGAEVMGSFPTEDDALAELQEQCPHAAPLDINPGPGTSFNLAKHLKDKGIPFMSVTGYDQAVIPAKFAHVRRLEKPTQLRQIVSSVREMIAQIA